jgi:hypothetical protein
MACKTESKLDRLSMLLASGVSRREVFKYIGVTALGGVLTTVGVRKAEAAACATNCPGCPAGVSCRENPPGHFCYCFQLAKNPAKCKCLGDFSCEGVIACNTNADCKASLGKGSKCIAASCCGTFKHCAPKCGNGLAGVTRAGTTTGGGS